MEINDEKTWPSEIVAFLEEKQDIFRNWKTGGRTVDPKDYDKAVYAFCRILREVNPILHGYHCTRLTDEEIQNIRDEGMSLPSGSLLKKRIKAVEQDGLIDTQTAEYLINSNEADDDHRAGMIWFCFFLPRIAGQWGIERFFRSWGGEALYNTHENDPIYGPVLRKIGIPCLIEANVPIRSLADYGGVDLKMIARFLDNRGLKSDNEL